MINNSDILFIQQVYDELLRPHVEAIIDACEKNKLCCVMGFQLRPNDLINVTIHFPDECRDGSGVDVSLQVAALVLSPRSDSEKIPLLFDLFSRVMGKEPTTDDN